MSEYGLTLITPPAVEPVSLAEAKAHLRVTFSDDDTLIDTLITAARQWFERQTYRQLITATWRLTLDRFPRGCRIIRLPRAPLQSVGSITYIDTAGDEQTMDAADYAVSTDREPGEIRLAYNKSWPTARWQPDAITINFDAGYGDAASDVPALTIAAIKLLVASLYEHREEQTDMRINTIPLGAGRIMAMFDVGDELLEYGGQTGNDGM